MKKTFTLALAISTLLVYSCTKVPVARNTIDKKVDKLLSQMSLDEKIGQMSQIDPGTVGTEENLKKLVREGRCGSIINCWGAERVNELQRIAVRESRLGIPLLIGRDVIHGYRTAFPIPLGMASSWDPEMVKKAYRIAAVEASSQGIRWSFAPMIDITWDPRWGRIAEGCGEDPCLASALAKAMVEGLQGDSLTDPTSVAACAKHYCGYGFTEGGRDYNTTYITEPVLRNVVLKPFRAAKEAGVLTFMSAFNDLDGIPASGNEFTLKQILRKEWKFDGFVVSDWGSIPEMVDHGFCVDEKDAACKALNAGVDMEMVTGTYHDNFKKLLEEKKITQEEIDNSVRNILKVKFRLGLFDNPFVNRDAQKVILDPSFIDHARKAARESAVLLKNCKKTLPLSTGISSVAVIGPLSDSPRDQLGTWCLDAKPENSVTPLKALKELLGDKRVNFVAGLTYSRDKRTDQFNRAILAAKSSDAVIFFGGEEWVLSGEGQCRGEINLPGAQSELIAELAKTGKPLILVIMAGRPLAIGKEVDESSAVLYAWHGGTMAGPAIADLLFGKESPSGKLPVTFVKGAGQIPFYYYRDNTGRPATRQSWVPIDSIPVENPQNSMGYRSFQLDYGFTPLFPFGFGLSYTTFTYSDLSLSSPDMKTNGSITVSAKVANTGDADADEIVQFYIRDRVGSITRPIKELKGFKRIHLGKGEKTRVEFTLKGEDLSFFNGKITATEKGKYDVWIGTSSEEGLHGEFVIE
ncbi:MAG: beta-glucosidase BglX [Bacteroidales bacterium]|jgi:beta-glucosidase